MLGDVREWTADPYGAYRTYDGFAAVSSSEPSNGPRRVYRRGSVSDIAIGLDSVERRPSGKRLRANHRLRTLSSISVMTA